MAELKPCNARNYKHGAYMRNPRLYGVWTTMMHRCYDDKRSRYKDYGGRGIRVCEEWHDPNAFIDWAEANGWGIGLQLDRKENNADYSPENCRFTTPKANNRNRRNTKYLTINGQTKCVAEWCETIKVSPYTIYWWIREKGAEYAERRLSEIA